MANDKFLIAPFDNGLNTSLKPFAIPDNAFSEMRNAYAWRGRIVKRFGSELSGAGTTNSILKALYSKGMIDLSSFTASLCYGLGQTDKNGAFTVNLPLTLLFAPGQYFNVGQYFKIISLTNTSTFTLTVTGNPANLTVVGVGTGTLDTTTGELIIAGTTA